MRAIRSLWWLVLVLPLAAPAPAPMFVAGHAYALSEAAPSSSAPVESDATPSDDGIRDVRSWIIPPPTPPAPPEREWGYGTWAPVWHEPGGTAPIVDERPLEQTSGDGGIAPPDPAPTPAPAPAPEPSPETAPAPQPAPPSGPEPEPAPEPEEDGQDEGSASSCLLCFLLEAPRRLGIL